MEESPETGFNIKFEISSFRCLLSGGFWVGDSSSSSGSLSTRVAALELALDELDKVLFSEKSVLIVAALNCAIGFDKVACSASSASEAKCDGSGIGLGAATMPWLAIGKLLPRLGGKWVAS